MVAKQELIDHFTAQGWAVNDRGFLWKIENGKQKRIRLLDSTVRYEQHFNNGRTVLQEWFLISSAYYTQITIEDGVLKGL